MFRRVTGLSLLLAAGPALAFVPSSVVSWRPRFASSSSLQMLEGGGTDGSLPAMDRRAVLSLGAAAGLFLRNPSEASAIVFFDPACYGDQESRSGAVGGCESRVREAILKNPQLARSFFKLALLDGLSYNSVPKDTPGGPDGSIVPVILSMTGNEELALMQDACKVLIEISKQRNKKDIKTVTLLDAVTIGDAVAIAGTSAIESVGGPILSVQLGRTEPDSLRPSLANLKGVKPTPQTVNLVKAFTQPNTNKDPALDKAVEDAFANAGLTDREFTVILGALLVVDKIDLASSNKNFAKSDKGQIRERGKIGRSGRAQAKLSDADFENANNDDDDEAEDIDAADKPFIVDSFGARGDIYGAKATKSIDNNSFNKYFGPIADFKRTPSSSDFWHERILSSSSARQVNAGTYAKSNLKYLKDLRTAYNSVTQLGAKFTGGKYESLLGNKKRKTLNDDLD